jgi:L-ascorbate 6-phosphate lactonase
MSDLARRIEQTKVDQGSLMIFWLAQAGFVFKTSSDKIVYIDPYLSDVVERAFGFQRMMSCPIRAEDVVTDLVLCTHEHLDHMDTDALPIIAKDSRTRFAGPVECVKEFRKMGIAEERCHLLEEGQEADIAGVRVKGVYADHGELAPDAIGIVLDFDGIQVYHTGDTAYRPNDFKPAIEMRPDILLPCINGRYGNMNSEEAALLVRDADSRLAIASHFWMFVEHNGDPALFLERCAQLAPGTQALVLKPGACHVFRQAASSERPVE